VEGEVKKINFRVVVAVLAVEGPEIQLHQTETQVQELPLRV
jgi:hypothetical protein